MKPVLILFLLLSLSGCSGCSPIPDIARCPTNTQLAPDVPSNCVYECRSKLDGVRAEFEEHTRCDGVDVTASGEVEHAAPVH